MLLENILPCLNPKIYLIRIWNLNSSSNLQLEIRFLFYFSQAAQASSRPNSFSFSFSIAGPPERPADLVFAASCRPSWFLNACGPWRPTSLSSLTSSLRRLSLSFDRAAVAFPRREYQVSLRRLHFHSSNVSPLPTLQKLVTEALNTHHRRPPLISPNRSLPRPFAPIKGSRALAQLRLSSSRPHFGPFSLGTRSPSRSNGRHCFSPTLAEICRTVAQLLPWWAPSTPPRPQRSMAASSCAPERPCASTPARPSRHCAVGPWWTMRRPQERRVHRPRELGTRVFLYRNNSKFLINLSIL
jgi:hypothetical protein